MSKKDTNESFDLKNTTKYKRVGEYQGSQNKIEFLCTTCNTIWLSTPNSILNLKGCPSCFFKKDTNESFDLKNTTKYKRIGEYTGSKIKIEFQCSICQNIWSIRPLDILQGNGCSICNGNNKYTHESFDKRNTSEYKRVGNYINLKTKIHFKCLKCLNIWKVTPISILQGSGCPYCVTTGFQISKRGYLYFIQIEDFLKVGITNREPIKRYKEITDSTVTEIKIIEGLGKDIYGLEQLIHKTFKHYYPTTLKNGHTECFPSDLKEQILQFITIATSRG